MMGLLDHFMRLWHMVRMPQRRSSEKIATTLLAMLAAFGERTITGALCYLGLTDCDWSGRYFHFSRGTWSADAIFRVAMEKAIRRAVDLGHPFIPVAIDDTSLPTSSRKGGLASYGRDPRSPPWNVNLRLQLRHVHSAIVVPHYQDDYRPLAVSTGFILAPPAKKPKPEAGNEAHQAWKEHVAQHGLSAVGVQILTRHREYMDQMHLNHLPLLAVVDGSYLNKNVLRNLPDRTALIGRCRKDIVLYHPGLRRRRYGPRASTPEELRQDDTPWTSVTAHYGGRQRTINYKVSGALRWRATGTDMPVRIIVIRPTHYRGPGGHRSYREPAYLLTTDLTTPVRPLIQAYLDRWQIEVIHRDLKHDCRLGTAQVRNPNSVKNLHAAVVGANALLHLAAEEHCGRRRTEALPVLPLWRRNIRRRNVSQQELLTLLRSELAQSGLTPQGKGGKGLTNRETRPQAA